tara:strand:+ start:4036 stop:5493 length:1458 start_codon:yes stop_codon:yes gene_type:complete
MPNEELIAVTGSTGYVGGRLVPRLLESGYRVRCVTRSKESLANRSWSNQVEIVEADLQNKNQTLIALADADRAFYLVHSMTAQRNFAEAEENMASVFAEAANESNLKQIVYLGGLGEDNLEKSLHLQSRHNVGKILAAGRTPVSELRAAVIIGSGSASFEMLRSLVEVLPIMVVPRWVTKTQCQPISIGDVLENLLHVLDTDDPKNHILEIGGPEVVTYREMMHAYTKVAGLRRRVILPVPVLTPRLSSHWVNLVSPLPFTLARALIDSLTTDVVVQGGHEKPGALSNKDSLEAAIGKALARIKELEIPTRWSDTSSFKDPAIPESTDPVWSGGKILVERREIVTSASEEALMKTICSVGGDNGWFAFNWLWAIRGFVDKLLGGVGLRRGRRHPTDLRVGDTVDFFKVTSITENRLQLLAEMRVPGHAWLEWNVKKMENGDSLVTQQALFVPKGVLGRAYWYVLLLPHIVIFSRMLNNLVEKAES